MRDRYRENDKKYKETIIICHFETKCVLFQLTLSAEDIYQLSRHGNIVSYACL